MGLVEDHPDPVQDAGYLTRWNCLLELADIGVEQRSFPSSVGASGGYTSLV
jgi:hypothetical protein